MVDSRANEAADNNPKNYAIRRLGIDSVPISELFCQKPARQNRQRHDDAVVVDGKRAEAEKLRQNQSARKNLT